MNDVYDDLAAHYPAGEIDTGWLIAKVEQLVVGFSFDDACYEPPLGSLYQLHDEWEAGWDRSRDQLAALVHQACTEQLRQASATSN